MRVFIKLILLSIITIFALFNYRVLNFDKGFSKTNLNNMGVVEVLTTVSNIEKVEYYKMPFMSENNSPDRPSYYQSFDYIYRVYIVTSEDAYLLGATADDIRAFKTLGIFSKNLSPNKITPIPYVVEIIAGLILICIPFGKRKAKTEQKR